MAQKAADMLFLTAPGYYIFAFSDDELERLMTHLKSWGFPRWSGYGKERETLRVRLCDRTGCRQPGDYPAPKSALSDEKWWFCHDHVVEYNRSWNYFEGLSKDEARAQAEREERTSRGYARADTWGWGGSQSANERRRSEAFTVLELDEDADAETVKRQFRKLAKQHHPDRNRDDPEADERFRRVCAAYELLRED
jgi:hypothetical protein